MSRRVWRLYCAKPAVTSCVDSPIAPVELAENSPNGVGRPAMVRVRCRTGIPILAWGLGIGRQRRELYPLVS